MKLTNNMCPVCGQEIHEEGGIIYNYFPKIDKTSVCCENCGCSTDLFNTEEDAEAAWNKMCEMRKEDKK